MLKDKILEYGLNLIKKNFSYPESSIAFESRRIRERYHRIRSKYYDDVTSGKIKLEKPILMIGVPHSGTSVLASIFSSHPDIAMWTEAPEVWEPYWAEGIDSEYNRLVPKYENEVEDMDVLRITDAFYRFVASKKRTRLLNKNPRNTVRINFMKRIFPDAKIVHIFRDGRDVVNSITRGMPDFMIEKICDRWINSLNEVKNQLKKIPSSDFYDIKYEDFCERPNEIIIDVFEKFELKVNEKIQNKLPTKLPNYNGLWKKEMNEKYHDLLEQKLSPTLKIWGYN